MPLSSAEIASLNATFSQQQMQRMQYSSLISPEYNFGGMNHRAGQEGMAARGINTASAVGAPMAMAGLGLMGLDPMSMGLRAGASVAGSAGFGAGAAAGAAVAAPLALGVSALGYMGNQIASGAQQTQQFNNSMRSSYSFFNPHSDSGRGFGGSDIREIGGYIRGQSGGHMGGMGGSTLSQFQDGPGFNELGRLASNMGRMGLADGVRNAKEFKEKFSEMVKTVTKIATDMGTSLEEAQKAMASMKGSGIFKNQAGVSSAIRGASVAGGLATTEVTGMMNVGSQISRMFGGTGKQGAMGGIEAIAQVGTAQQVGALSEEDIYNATGQTGAEGRRAMAQQQMLQTGSFLKSSKGRWMLASLAGKDGKLDSSSVAEFVAGGMGVNATRNAAHRNLAGIGRANFIRNEGRLRGAVMEEFGGLAPAMAMTGWAQERGIDINSMGDREMLFMQRQMGLGRDEADALVKMARKMPELMQARREAKQDDAGVQEHQLRARDSGMEGIKRKLENARDSVNNEMQKVGQDILNSATDKIAEWGNRIAGTYEEHSIEGIREASRAAGLGGSRGKEIMQGLVGGGGKFLANIKGGKGSDAGLHEDVGQRNYVNRQSDLQFAARMGSAGGMSSDLPALVQANSSGLKEAYGKLGGIASRSGEDRMSAFQAYLNKSESGGDFAESFAKGQSKGQLSQQYHKLDARGKAALQQQVEQQIGINGEGRLSETFEAPGLPKLVGGKEYTEAQRQEAWGKSILGIGAKQTKVQYNGFGQKMEAVSDDSVGNSDAARAAGSMFDKAESRQIAMDTLSGKATGRDQLHTAMANIQSGAAAHGGKLTASETGQLGFYNSVDITAEIDAKGGTDKLTPKDWDELIEKQKKAVALIGGEPSQVNKASITAQTQGIKGSAMKVRDEIVGQLSKLAGTDARSDQNVLLARGKSAPMQLISRGKGAGLEFELSDAKDKGSAYDMAMSVQNLGLRVGRSSDKGEQANLLSQQQEAHSKLYDAMGDMSVKQLKEYGAKMAGTSFGGEASDLLMRGQSLSAGTKRLGAVGAVGNQLGLNLSPEDMAGLKGKGSKAGAAALAARLGVSDDTDFTKALEGVIDATGKSGVKGAELLHRATGQASQATKDKLDQAQHSKDSPEEKIIEKLADGNKLLQQMVDASKPLQSSLNMITNNTTPVKDGEK